MPLSEKKKVSNDRYLKSTFDELKIRVPKGQKEVLQTHAQERDESLNSFVNRSINETMERDTNNTPTPQPTETDK